jgi:hypothetical protein
MTPAGWTIMIASVAGVTAAWVYCIGRVLRLPPRVAEEHVVSRLETPEDEFDAECRT